MNSTVCKLCDEAHEIRGVCPKRVRAEEGGLSLGLHLVEVEPAQPLQWCNDHGPACTCLACVVARGEKRKNLAEKIAAERAAKLWGA